MCGPILRRGSDGRGSKARQGYPIMGKIAITGQYDIEARKRMVKRLAGIKDQLFKSPCASLF
jgi:hypothetical protein